MGRRRRIAARSSSAHSTSNSRTCRSPSPGRARGSCASPRRGDTAVIVGAGIMGLLHLAVLRSSGAVVIVSEPDRVRRAKAIEMGADVVIDPSAEDYVGAVQWLTDGRGASVTYMAIGVPSAIEAAVQGAAKRGIVSVYASVHPRGTTI